MEESMEKRLVKDPTDIKSYYLAVVAIVFICLSWPAILLRLYVRHFLVKSFGKDDFTALIGQICFTAFCAVGIVANQMRVPQEQQNIENTKKIIRVGMSSGLLYCWATIFIKVSLGLSFLRVLSVISQRAVAWGLIAASVIGNITLFFFLLFSCGNPAQFADKVIMGKCKIDTIQFEALMYFNSSINILVDIGLLALPVSTIMRSRMGKKAKISVILIFTIACSGTICSIIRLYFLTTFFSQHLENDSIGGILSIIEGGVFIIAGCLATMRVLLHINIFSRVSKYLSTSGRSLVAQHPEKLSKNKENCEGQ